MKTSVSTLKVNQKAQKAVDTAESSIKKFSRFLTGKKTKLGKDIPGKSQFTKAENFINKFKGDKKGGGGGGKMIMTAVGAMMMLPLLLSKGNKTKAEELPTDDQFAGDEKAQEQQIKEEDKTKTDALKKVEETVKTGKELSKTDLKQLKEVKTEEKKEEEKKDDEVREKEKEEKPEEPVEEEKKKDEVTGDINEEQLTRFSSLVDGLKSRFTEMVSNPAQQENVEGAMNVKSQPTVEQETGSMEVKGELTPEMAAGGWIEGPQSGYPVSLDGKGVDFIGHGKEYVSKGPAGSAFIVPFDTPATRKDPSLTGRRMKEAKSMGFSAGGKFNPKRFFGLPLMAEGGKTDGRKVIPFTGKVGYRAGEINPPSLIVTRTNFTSKSKETHNKKLKQKVGKEIDIMKEKTRFGEDGYYGFDTKVTTKLLKKFEGGTFEETEVYESSIANVAIEDLKEHQQQLMKQIRAVKGFEKKTFIDVINGTVNMPLKKYIDILNTSDAARATFEKKDKASKLDRKEHGYNWVVEGFSSGGLIVPYNFAKGGFYDNMNHYPEYDSGGAYGGAESGGNTYLMGQQPPSMPSQPSGGGGSDTSMIPIGNTDSEVFSTFLFNELGAS